MGQPRSRDDMPTHHQQKPSVQVFEHSSIRVIDEAGFSKQLEWVNSSEQDRDAMLKENGLYRLAATQ